MDEQHGKAGVFEAHRTIDLIADAGELGRLDAGILDAHGAGGSRGSEPA